MILIKLYRAFALSKSFSSSKKIVATSKNIPIKSNEKTKPQEKKDTKKEKQTYDDPHLLRNRILFMLRLDNVEDAISLNEASATRSVYSYNAIIDHLFTNGEYKLGLKQFNKMKKRNISPNNHTHTIMLNNCTNMEPADIYNMIDSIIKYRNTKLNLIHYNTIIKIFGRKELLEDCSSLYQQFKRNINNFLNPSLGEDLEKAEHDELSEIDYNKVLNQDNEPKEKDKQRVNCGLFPDSTTYVTIINFYTNIKSCGIDKMIEIVNDYIADFKCQREYTEKNGIRIEKGYPIKKSKTIPRSTVDIIETDIKMNFVRRKLDLDIHIINAILLNLKNKATRQRELTSAFYLLDKLFELGITSEPEYTDYKKSSEINDLADRLCLLRNKKNEIVPDKVLINTIIQIGTFSNKLNLTYKTVSQLKKKYPELLIDINHYSHMFSLISQTLQLLEPRKKSSSTVRKTNFE